MPHPPPLVRRPNRKPCMRPRHCIRRMNHATQRLRKRRLPHIQILRQPHHIAGRHRDKFRQPPRQSRNPMLRVKRALVRIPAQTIFTPWLAMRANAIQPLIHHHAVAHSQVANLTTHFRDLSADFVPQNLRLHRKRNALPGRIRVVVRVSRKNVRVSPANPHRRNAQQPIARAPPRLRNIPHFNPPHVAEHTSLHPRILRVTARPNDSKIPQASESPVPAPLPSANDPNRAPPRLPHSSPPTSPAESKILRPPSHRSAPASASPRASARSPQNLSRPARTRENIQTQPASRRAAHIPSHKISGRAPAPNVSHPPQNHSRNARNKSVPARAPVPTESSRKNESATNRASATHSSNRPPPAKTHPSKRCAALRSDTAPHKRKPPSIQYRAPQSESAHVPGCAPAHEYRPPSPPWCIRPPASRIPQPRANPARSPCA